MCQGEEKIKLKARFNKVKSALSKFIDDKGKTIPGFLPEWRGANAAFATIAQSRKVSDIFARNAEKIPPYILGSAAFQLFSGHPYAMIPAAGAIGAVKTSEALYQVMKNPTLRQHYINVSKKAAEQNFPAALKALEKFNKALEKEKGHSLSESSKKNPSPTLPSSVK